MNKLFIVTILWLALASCAKEQQMTVTVKNTTDLNRDKETVELCWKGVAEKLQGITPENVVVYDAAGQEIPSQVIYRGGEVPVALIFQATVAPNAEVIYQVKQGQRAEYPQQAYGRYVPERMDDYAWENNLVGHRMYGPALEATGEISNGIDTWVKRTDELLINEWYKTGDYHKDHGKGMDCYKVGRTLGSGAMAPYAEGQFVLGNNYIAQKTLDNGPVRISFQLDYAPYAVGNTEVKETRTISLDANNRFNKIQEVYEGAGEGMEVAAGIVTRPEPSDTLRDATLGIMGYWEPQNNDNGDNNGHIGIGVIFPEGAKKILSENGHIFAVADYKAGEPYVYYMGTAWSKGGVESADAWFELLNQERTKLKNPLVVNIK